MSAASSARSDEPKARYFLETQQFGGAESKQGNVLASVVVRAFIESPHIEAAPAPLVGKALTSGI